MTEIGAKYRVLVYTDGDSAGTPVATFPGTGPTDFYTTSQLSHTLPMTVGDYQVKVVAYNPNTVAGSEPASAVSGKVTGARWPGAHQPACVAPAACTSRAICTRPAAVRRRRCSAAWRLPSRALPLRP